MYSAVECRLHRVDGLKFKTVIIVNFDMYLPYTNISSSFFDLNNMHLLSQQFQEKSVFHLLSHRLLFIGDLRVHVLDHKHLLEPLVYPRLRLEMVDCLQVKIL